ncbi:MAG: RNA polymerase subunit sigma [Ignavibacteriae bacterium]|nr:MAG: RNA polymerase subunit sigma [Ignavibacteriota bacterium]
MKISKKNTKKDSHTLDKYLQEISKVELLTPEEEIEFSTRIKRGDQAALDRLVKANLRFVVSVAKQYQNQGMSLGDLINEGNLGLIKAAKRFDETRGFKFISYAVWWIRQSILQALAEQSGIVRLPLNRVGALNKIGRAFKDLEQEYEREPTPEEIAQELEMDLDEVTETLRINTQHISVDAPFGSDDDAGNLLDVLESNEHPLPDSELMSNSLKGEIEKTLSSLSEREAEVLKLYFGFYDNNPLTLEEIAVKFNLTRERVRQIKEKAIRKLRHASRNRNLRNYLG